MLTTLPAGFQHNNYGLQVRLVTEADTDFVMKMRTDTFRTRFIHQTENDVQKHIEWFKKYKQREAEGRDYYFIYFKNGQPVGLNRIYNIFEYYGTIGSWICPADNEVETSMGTYFLMLDILFEHLNLDLSVFDVRKTNKHVWKLHKMVGAQPIGESDIDYYFALNKPTYFQNREKLLPLFNLK